MTFSRESIGQQAVLLYILFCYSEHSLLRSRFGVQHVEWTVRSGPPLQPWKPVKVNEILLRRGEFVSLDVQNAPHGEHEWSDGVLGEHVWILLGYTCPIDYTNQDQSCCCCRLSGSTADITTFRFSAKNVQHVLFFFPKWKQNIFFNVQIINLIWLFVNLSTGYNIQDIPSTWHPVPICHCVSGKNCVPRPLLAC